MNEGGVNYRIEARKNLLNSEFKLPQHQLFSFFVSLSRYM